MNNITRLSLNELETNTQLSRLSQTSQNYHLTKKENKCIISLQGISEQMFGATTRRND